MAFCFTPEDSSLRAGFRRIALERCSSAIAALEDGAGPLDKRVHEARKSIKKLRALLRLTRPEFKRFRDENRALRDTGRVLAPLRDADVTAPLLAELGAEAGLGKAVLKRLRAELQATAAPGDAETRVAGAAAALIALADRIPSWRLDARGFDALSGGLCRSWDDAATAMRAALPAGGTLAIHDWRKRVKDHWYHARMLAPLWPEAMEPHVAAVGSLGDLLGRHQDLAVLEDRLGGTPEALPVLALAARRRAALLAEAEPLARRLWCEPGKSLARRWSAWWETGGYPSR